MIDGIKFIVVCVVAADWLRYTDMKFKGTYEHGTGEVVDKTLICVYKGLTFKLKPSTIEEGKIILEVSGSLHRYRNNGGRNNDDFNFQSLGEVIRSLEKYGIKAHEAILQNIEIGVNIRLPFSCERFFDGLISRNEAIFTEIEETGFHGKEIKKQESNLKFYDKERQQSGKPSNLLRVEVKVNKMRQLQSTEIETLHDLTDADKIINAGYFLLKSLESIIMFDGTESDIQKIQDGAIRENFLAWKLPGHWKKLKDYQRTRERKKFAEMSERYGFLNLHELLINTVRTKWNELLNKNESGLCKDFTDFQDNNLSENESGFSESGFENESGLCKDFTVKINGEIPARDNNGEAVELLEKNLFKIKNNKFLPKTDFQKNETLRRCKSCGVDISRKRPQSIFCSVRCRNAASNKTANKKRHVFENGTTRDPDV